ncbi:MAG: hypothetical protein ABEJ88_09940 [Halobacterium sp.]
MLRRIMLVVGVLFAALGIGVAVQPGLVSTIRLPDLPTVVIGGLAFVLAAETYLARRHTDFRDERDDASEYLESRREVPRPGADVDERLASGPRSRTGGSRDERFRERLRLLTVQVLVDARGLGREEAHEQLDDGTWTEDTTAASFFADEIDPPTGELVGSIVGGSRVYDQQAQHVVTELQRIAGLHGGEQ